MVGFGASGKPSKEFVRYRVYLLPPPAFQFLLSPTDPTFEPLALVSNRFFVILLLGPALCATRCACEKD